jgi:hypothetical protein
MDSGQFSLVLMAAVSGNSPNLGGMRRPTSKGEDSCFCEVFVSTTNYSTTAVCVSLAKGMIPQPIGMTRMTYPYTLIYHNNVSLNPDAVLLHSLVPSIYVRRQTDDV